jgi:hypothetical protein
MFPKVTLLSKIAHFLRFLEKRSHPVLGRITTSCPFMNTCRREQERLKEVGWATDSKENLIMLCTACHAGVHHR